MGPSIVRDRARQVLVLSALLLAPSEVAVADANRVQDPHFDQGTTTPIWSGIWGGWGPLDATGTPGSGSAVLQGICFPVVGEKGLTHTPLIPVIAGATYSFGANARGSVSPGGAAWIEVHWGVRNPGSECVGSIRTDLTPSGGNPDAWEAVSLTAIAPAGAECARLRANVSCMPGNPHLAYVDDVYLFRVGTTGAFHTVTPCRVVDTRGPAGPLGGPPLLALEPRVFAVAGTCGIPANATDVAANVTVANATADGHLEMWTPGGTLPYTSVLNFGAFQPRANNAVLRLDIAGGVIVRAVMPNGSADVVVDVVGYYE